APSFRDAQGDRARSAGRSRQSAGNQRGDRAQKLRLLPRARGITRAGLSPIGGAGMHVPNARHIYVGNLCWEPVMVFTLMSRAAQSDGRAGIPVDADAGKVFLRSMNTATSRQV